MSDNKNIIYVVTLTVIFIFVCLTGGLCFPCGSLFSDKCQTTSHYKDITGLVATSLVIFFVALVFSILLLIKKYKWALYGELVATGIGAILMLAAVCLIYQNGWNVARLMGVIAMTFSLELVAFMLFELFK